MTDVTHIRLKTEPGNSTVAEVHCGAPGPTASTLSPDHSDCVPCLRKYIVAARECETCRSRSLHARHCAKCYREQGEKPHVGPTLAAMRARAASPPPHFTAWSWVQVELQNREAVAAQVNAAIEDRAQLLVLLDRTIPIVRTADCTIHCDSHRSLNSPCTCGLYALLEDLR